MSGNGDDDEGPRSPRVSTCCYDVIQTAAMIHEETSSTGACIGTTSDIFRSIYTRQCFCPASENRDSLSRNRLPVRRASTWGQ